MAGEVAVGSTKQERIDFLKQVVAFTEANVRSYDTKAQISLAAFVLSANPLVTITNTACSQNSGKTVLIVLLWVYIATILTYVWVLWPVAPPPARLTERLGSQNLFYLHDPLGASGTGYSTRLQTLMLEPELTAEALKLSYIRKVKAGRFKAALVATLLAYAAMAVSFFAIGRCM